MGLGALYTIWLRQQSTPKNASAVTPERKGRGSRTLSCWGRRTICSTSCPTHAIQLERIRNFHIKQAFVKEKGSRLSYKLLDSKHWVQDPCLTPQAEPQRHWKPAEVMAGPGDAAALTAGPENDARWPCRGLGAPRHWRRYFLINLAHHFSSTFCAVSKKCRKY